MTDDDSTLVTKLATLRTELKADIAALDRKIDHHVADSAERVIAALSAVIVEASVASVKAIEESLRQRVGAVDDKHTHRTDVLRAELDQHIQDPAAHR
jgi:hypothetical protein